MNRIKLKGIPLFNNISENDFPTMLECIGSVVKTFKKGENIFTEQDNIGNIGVILSGKVHMIKEDIRGNSTIIAQLGRGETFGEAFVLTGSERIKISVSAVADSEIMFFPFQRVIHTCDHGCNHHKRLVDNMVGIIALKNLRLLEKIEVVTKKTLREKIMAYLSIQAQQHDSVYFEIPLGRVEFAEYLCADRSALTRELNLMRDEGIIDFDKNMFRIKK